MRLTLTLVVLLAAVGKLNADSIVNGSFEGAVLLPGWTVETVGGGSVTREEGEGLEGDQYYASLWAHIVSPPNGEYSACLSQQFTTTSSQELRFDYKAFGWDFLDWGGGISKIDVRLVINRLLEDETWSKIADLPLEIIYMIGVPTEYVAYAYSLPSSGTYEIAFYTIVAETSDGGAALANLHLDHVRIPEPSAIALFGIAAVSLLAFAWRRKR